MSYSKKDCINALKEAKNRTGSSPTMKEYQKSGRSPSIDTILKNFDTWNKAKKKAGLSTYKQNNTIEPKPEEINLPESKKWEELSSY